MLRKIWFLKDQNAHPNVGITVVHSYDNNAAVKGNKEGAYRLKGSDIPDTFLRKKQEESVKRCVEYVEYIF